MELRRVVNDKGELEIVGSDDSLAMKFLIAQEMMDEICSHLDDLYQDDTFDSYTPEGKAFDELNERMGDIKESMEILDTWIDRVPQNIQMEYFEKPQNNPAEVEK